MTLTRKHAGLYATTDGAYEISYEKWYLDGECECALCLQGNHGECPHDGYGMREGWTIWVVAESRHLTGPFEFERMRDAREALAEHLRQKGDPDV